MSIRFYCGTWGYSSYRWQTYKDKEQKYILLDNLSVLKLLIKSERKYWDFVGHPQGYFLLADWTKIQRGLYL